MQIIISAKADTIDVEDLPKRITRQTQFKKRFKIGLGKSLEEVEAKYIRETLEECGGNKEHTARSLGISRKTLYNKIQKLGIDTNPRG